MRPTTSAVLACLVALTSTVAVGCGSSGSPAVDVLRGEYVATTAGPISSIDFEDATHYSLLFSSCSKKETCTESGKYVLASDDSTVTFTSTAGKVTVYPFQTLSAGSGFTATGPTTLSVHILGGQTALTGSSAALTSGNGTALTSGSGAILSSSNASLIAQVLEALIGSFNMGNQGFQGGGDAGAGSGAGSSGGGGGGGDMGGGSSPSDSSSSTASPSTSSTAAQGTSTSSSSAAADAGAGDASDAASDASDAAMDVITL
jgi:hypothetical protein